MINYLLANFEATIKRILLMTRLIDRYFARARAWIQAAARSRWSTAPEARSATFLGLRVMFNSAPGMD